MIYMINIHELVRKVSELFVSEIKTNNLEDYILTEILLSKAVINHVKHVK